MSQERCSAECAARECTPNGPQTYVVSLSANSSAESSPAINQQLADLVRVQQEVTEGTETHAPYFRVFCGQLRSKYAWICSR